MENVILFYLPNSFRIWVLAVSFFTHPAEQATWRCSRVLAALALPSALVVRWALVLPWALVVPWALMVLKLTVHQNFRKWQKLLRRVLYWSTWWIRNGNSCGWKNANNWLFDEKNRIDARWSRKISDCMSIVRNWLNLSHLSDLNSMKRSTNHVVLQIRSSSIPLNFTYQVVQVSPVDQALPHLPSTLFRTGLSAIHRSPWKLMIIKLSKLSPSSPHKVVSEYIE